MPDILIHSPYIDNPSQGNSVTAVRTERLLAGAGYRVNHSECDYSGESADVMIRRRTRPGAGSAGRGPRARGSAGLLVGGALLLAAAQTERKHGDRAAVREATLQAALQAVIGLIEND